MDKPTYVWPLDDDDLKELRSSLEPPREPWQAPSCSGNCAQGRRLCVTPEACRLPDTEDADKLDGAGAIVIPIVVASAAIVCFVVYLIVRAL
jgi:hypothetical protein